MKPIEEGSPGRLLREGFWKPDDHSYLPLPQPSEFAWRGKSDFLVSLSRVEAKAKQVSYRGWSTCRICKEPNGSREFRHEGWAWPQGYRHYVEEHNVRPSLAFHEFIVGMEIK